MGNSYRRYLCDAPSSQLSHGEAYSHILSLEWRSDEYHNNQATVATDALRRTLGNNVGVNVMISSHLCAIADNGSLTIKINGPMDLRLTSALREYCHDTGVAYSRYIVDFRNVSIVRDSGLALLLMLKRLVNRAGSTLHVINGNTDLMHRCLKLGI